MKLKPGIGDAPIEPRLHGMMNGLASGLDDILNGEGTAPDKRKNGFVLLVFPLADHEGRCNYISNADRQDIIVLLKEQLARLEGRPSVVGHG